MQPHARSFASGPGDSALFVAEPSPEGEASMQGMAYEIGGGSPDLGP